MKLLVTNPNLSIVVPGPCNARCSFCFWNRNAEVQKDYLPRLRRILATMPPEFDRITLTGGEPTLSPVFPDILEAIDRKRWKKLVLATNGLGLLDPKVLSLVGHRVDHVNLSRHSHDDRRNAAVFNAENLPTTDALKGLVTHLWDQFGVDTTINTVIRPACTPGFVMEMIRYAQALGAVGGNSFRLEQGNMEPSGVEKFFTSKFPVRQVQTCPTCATIWQSIEGHPINWKRSVLEPSLDWGGVYEAIVQQDGRLTLDWQGQVALDLNVEPLAIPSKGSGTSPRRRGAAGKSGCGAEDGRRRASCGGC